MSFQKYNTVINEEYFNVSLHLNKMYLYQFIKFCFNHLLES